MRCFIAIELDARIRGPLEQWIEREIRSLSGLRAATGEQLHITLKFLGEVPEDRVARIAAVLAETAAQVAPFPIGLERLGAFPSASRARVLWCGIADPGGGMARWLALAEPALTLLGYPAEGRAFQAHVTLARARDAGGSRAIARLLSRSSLPDTPQMEVRELVLFQSRLSPQGARYEALARAALRGTHSGPAG